MGVFSSHSPVEAIIGHSLLGRMMLLRVPLPLSAPFAAPIRPMASTIYVSGAGFKREKPVHCLLTKADKLNRSESTNALKQVDTILKSYVDEEGNPFPFTAQLFSSTKRIGIKEATDTILQLAGRNEPPDTPDLPEQ